MRVNKVDRGCRYSMQLDWISNEKRINMGTAYLIFGCCVTALQRIGAAKVLLDVPGARGLPGVGLVAEDAGMVTDLLNDAVQGLLLLGLTGDGLAVGGSLGRPPNLRDELAPGSGFGAHFGSLLELLVGKFTGLGSSLATVEVWLDLSGKDVDDIAESRTILLPGCDSLGGGHGDGGRETSAVELLLYVLDIAREGASVATVAGDVLVADDEHGHGILGGVLDDVLELLIGTLGVRAVASVEEDAVDDVESMLLAGGDNVLENAAVGTVDTDGGVAEVGDLADVVLHFSFGLAVSTLGVGSVGDGPLIAVGLVPVALATSVGRRARFGLGGSRL